MGLYFEDIEVGATYETPSRTVEARDVAAFADLTGDHNPLHTDEAFARAGPYGERIAHGPLVLSLAVGLMSASGFATDTALGLVAVDDWHFLAPVRMGDAIRVIFTVTGKRESSKPGRGIVERRVRVVDQDGRTVQEGNWVILVRTRGTR